MKAIWKFPITVKDDITILMPAGAKILTVQEQNGMPCLWAVVDPGAPNVSRRLRIYGTGHSVPTDLHLRYVGTFQLERGELVFHLFEQGYGPTFGPV